jgi:hypothetical protein
MNLIQLVVASIKTNVCALVRAGMSETTARKYADVLQAGGELPPGVVFRGADGDQLAAGFHRRRAHQLAGQKYMVCDVRPGGIRDAILFGIQDNARHGLPHSPEDRRRAVTTLLLDPEWKNWSTAELARVVSGSPKSGAAEELVREMRDKLSSLAGRMDAGRTARRTDKNGNSHTYTMTPGRRPEDYTTLLRVGLDSIDRARDMLVRVPDSEDAVLALDLARSLAAGLPTRAG